MAGSTRRYRRSIKILGYPKNINRSVRVDRSFRFDDGAGHAGGLVGRIRVLVYALGLEGVDGGLAGPDGALAVLPALAGGGFRVEPAGDPALCALGDGVLVGEDGVSLACGVRSVTVSPTETVSSLGSYATASCSTTWSTSSGTPSTSANAAYWDTGERPRSRVDATVVFEHRDVGVRFGLEDLVDVVVGFF